MLADFLTKPLQGSLFRKFRDVILGYQPVSSLNREPTPALERVEEHDEQPNDSDSVKRVTYADVASGKYSVTKADLRAEKDLIRLSKES